MVPQKKKSRLKGAVYFAVMFGAVFFLWNIYHQLSVLSSSDSSKNNAGVMAPSSARTPESQERRKQQWLRLIQMRRKPSWASVNDGAFIHMGKTGGSSLSLLLRNGCHSFMPKPCRTVPLETTVSKLVGTYYHGTWCKKLGMTR